MAACWPSRRRPEGPDQDAATSRQTSSWKITRGTAQRRVRAPMRRSWRREAAIRSRSCSSRWGRPRRPTVSRGRFASGMRTRAPRCVRSTGSPGIDHALVFTPEGSRLISAGDDGIVRIWEPSTGRLLAQARGAQARSSPWRPPTAGAWPRRGADGTIRIWDLDRPRLDPARSRGHANWVLGLAFSSGRLAARVGRRRQHRPALGRGRRPGGPHPPGPPRPGLRRRLQPRRLATGFGFRRRDLVRVWETDVQNEATPPRR